MIKQLAVYWFKKNGWRFIGILPKKHPAVVLLFGPQTSWHDILLAIAVRQLTRFRVRIVVDAPAKKWYNGYLLHLAGIEAQIGRPSAAWMPELIDDLESEKRTAVAFPFNHLNQINAYDEHTFYEVTRRSGAELVLVAIDHHKRIIKFHNPFVLSGFVERDMSYIRGFFHNYYLYPAWGEERK